MIVKTKHPRYKVKSYRRKDRKPSGKIKLVRDIKSYKLLRDPEQGFILGREVIK